jgi:hypothetical protein
VNIAGYENFPSGRTDTGEFEEDRTGFILGTGHTGPLKIVSCTGKR